MKSGDYKLIFRLPVPDEGGRVGFAGVDLPSLAEALEATGSSIVESPGAGSRCDLVVAKAPEGGADAAFFRRLAGAMAEGGAVAVIVANAASIAALPRRLRGKSAEGGMGETTLAAIVRSAAAAGLRMEDAIALVPDERNPSVIVPARDARGLGFILSHFPDFASGRSKGALRIAKLLVRCGIQAPLLGRYIVILRDAHAHGVPLPGLLRQAPASALVTRVEVDTQAILCFLFEPGERAPAAVLKAASEPGRNDELRREHDNLVSVRSAIPEPLAQSVPAVRGSGVWRGRFHYVQDFSRGTMLGSSLDAAPFGLRRRRIAADFDRAWDWLMRFQAATDAGFRPVRELGIGETLARYAAAHGGGGEDRAPIGWLASGLERYAARATPVSACHGDFFPGNVILGRDRVAVIDWRYFRRSHHRCFDVMTLLSTLRSSNAAPAGDEGDFERIFCRPHWTSELFRERFGTFFAMNGLDGDFFAFLCGAALLEMSIREHGESGTSGKKDAVWRGRLLRFHGIRGRIAAIPGGAGGLER